MKENEKHLVEFVNEKSFFVSGNESILQASLAAGIPHFHVCGGNAECSTCRVLVVDGEDALTPPGPKENRLKNKMHFPQQIRLACQTKVLAGPVRMKRIIQHESDIDLYVGREAGRNTQLMGKEAELVLFFLDIRNFTPLVQMHLPFDVIHIIRKLFAGFHKIIESNEGKILETTGDGFYAVFGSGSRIERYAQLAVKAAYSILDDLGKMNSEYFKLHFNQCIHIGIGIHMGKVVCGSIRLGNRDHMIVMGHPVNIASRLQNATKQLNNDFIASAEVCQLLPDFPAAPARSIGIKGISEPVKVFLLGKAYPG